MNYFKFIGQRAGQSLDILSKKLQICQLCKLIDENADVVIKSAKYMSEITPLTFQEALDKEIERLKKELK